jgi:hypothetical protein
MWSGHVDTYEPGTERERAYMRGISSIYQTDSIEDAAYRADIAMLDETQDCIVVQEETQDCIIVDI